MFPGFTTGPVRANGTTVHVCRGGAGPPVLLLHGYPQTHVMWHRVAPVLAERFTVICPDLRGYGDSDQPPGGPDHEGYSKRTMAPEAVAEYARCFTPAAVHASCEDYRAGAGIDSAHDRADADRPLSCPVL